VRDDERRIDFAFLYALHQNRQITLYRRLSHAKRESAIDRGTYWNFIDEAAIDAHDRDGSEIAAAINRLAQNERPIAFAVLSPPRPSLPFRLQNCRRKSSGGVAICVGIGFGTISRVTILLPHAARSMI
jgi:hypothetical protein